jgi:hypothetical protein
MNAADARSVASGSGSGVSNGVVVNGRELRRRLHRLGGSTVELADRAKGGARDRLAGALAGGYRPQTPASPGQNRHVSSWYAFHLIPFYLLSTKDQRTSRNCAISWAKRGAAIYHSVVRIGKQPSQPGASSFRYCRRRKTLRGRGGDRATHRPCARRGRIPGRHGSRHRADLLLFLAPTRTAPPLLIIGTLVLVNMAVASLDRWHLFHRLFAPKPSVIIRDGHFLPDRLRREGVTEDECESAPASTAWRASRPSG